MFLNEMRMVDPYLPVLPHRPSFWPASMRNETPRSIGSESGLFRSGEDHIEASFRRTLTGTTLSHQQTQVARVQANCQMWDESRAEIGPRVAFESSNPSTVR